MKKSFLATLFLGLILVLAACGGANENNDTNNQADNSTENAAASNNIDLVATNWDFDQDEYTVEAGEEVSISLTNEEGMHGIAIDEFDVEIEGDGETTFTPDEPGEYEIYCSIPCGEGHDDMVSTLVVE